CVRVGALHLQRPHVHAPCCVGRIGTGFPVRGARGRTRSARQARPGARGLVPAVRRLLLVLSKPTSSAAGASGARQRAPALTLARASRVAVLFSTTTLCVGVVYSGCRPSWP